MARSSPERSILPGRGSGAACSRIDSFCLRADLDFPGCVWRGMGGDGTGPWAVPFDGQLCSLWTGAPATPLPGPFMHIYKMLIRTAGSPRAQGRFCPRAPDCTGFGSVCDGPGSILVLPRRFVRKTVDY